MLPSFTTNDNTDLRLFHAELRSDASLRPSLGVEGSDPEHLIVGQPGVGVRGPLGSGQSALGFAVQDVVMVGPKEQMIWVSARRIVALMEHMKSICDRASMNFVRKAMGLILSDRSVTFPIDWATPAPAAVRLAPEDNVRPIESHWQFLGERSLDGSHVFRVHAAKTSASGSQGLWDGFWVGFFPKCLARIHDEICAVTQDRYSAMLGITGPYPAWRVGSTVNSSLNQQADIIAYHRPMISWAVA